MQVNFFVRILGKLFLINMEPPEPLKLAGTPTCAPCSQRKTKFDTKLSKIDPKIDVFLV